ncbi:MAG: SDR family oxidoreductase [Actinomycetota bacterium]|nr:SDR family oxidoreductase [Actinomycetota bacterium]
MAKCLVTGGGGFIGSHLVDALVADGHDVRVLDNFSTGDRRNLLHLLGEVEIIEGELRSFERVAAALRGCELVFHQAALPSVPRSVQDPLTTSEVNATGTLNLLLAARDGDVRRVVYASSSSVYGAAPVERKHEELSTAPVSPYGVSKQTGEAYCVSFFETYGLETVSLRYFNVFGPRQSPISEYAAVIPAFIAAALMEEEPTVYGDGAQSRDFTFVENVVDANLRAAHVPEAAGGVFNVGCGIETTINELLERIGEHVGRPLTRRYVAARPGEVRHSVADITRARTTLGYDPPIGLAEGLDRTYRHFLADESLVPRIRERRRWLAAV